MLFRCRPEFVAFFEADESGWFCCPPNPDFLLSGPVFLFLTRLLIDLCSSFLSPSVFFLRTVTFFPSLKRALAIFFERTFEFGVFLSAVVLYV